MKRTTTAPPSAAVKAAPKKAKFAEEDELEQRFVFSTQPQIKLILFYLDIFISFEDELMMMEGSEEPMEDGGVIEGFDNLSQETRVARWARPEVKDELNLPHVNLGSHRISFFVFYLLTVFFTSFPVVGY